MTAHRPALRLLPILLGFMVLATPAAAQQPTLEGKVTAEGFDPIQIAVPSAGADSAHAEEAAELVDTVRYDLAFSDFFDIVEPRLYGLVPPQEGSQVRHEDWESIGADALLALNYTFRSGQVAVDAMLYDNPSRKLLLHKRYAGGPELLRRVAHRVSDDLVQHYTGRPGIALTWISFVSKHGDGKELYLMDYDGKRIRRLTTTNTINLSPVWSPAGDRLAFVSWRGRQPGVFIMESSGVLEKVRIGTGELNAAPDWSPDGKKIAYSSDADGNSEIYVIDLASGRSTRLTRTAAIETAPAFSPLGREIAFTSDRSGTPQIYIMDAEGLNVRRLTFEGSYNDSAAWSPRGDRLAYVSRIDGRFDILVLDLATGARRRLTHGEGNSENPRWAPDGRHLVFASDRRGTYDIYTMRADGSNVVRLTKGGNCFTPDWSR